ncbi:hypothetical protein HAZT_HAZT007702, partial [Hyalella azteca]
MYNLVLFSLYQKYDSIILLNLRDFKLGLFVQILIVQVGGVAFSTAPLSLELWFWCILFGAATLLWGQVITSIPTHSLPKNVFSWGSGEPASDPIADLNNDDKTDFDNKDNKRTGQILWIRGLTRLQTQ